MPGGRRVTHRRSVIAPVMATRTQEKTKAKESASNTPPSDQISPTTIGTVMAVAGSLVVGVLAALGVAGNLLARMARNHVLLSFGIMAAVIAFVSLLLLTTVLHGRLRIVPVVGLAITLILAAALGASSQSTRENPYISLSLAKSDKGILTLTAKAAGSGLRSDEEMLLRVLGLKGSSETRIAHSKIDEQCRYASLTPLDSHIPQQVMAWIETGPNVSGDASTETAIPVPSNLRYVCAFAILSSRGDPEDPNRPPTQSSWALIDLKYVTATTVASGPIIDK